MEVEAIVKVIEVVNEPVHITVTGGVVVIVAVTWDIRKSHYNSGMSSTWTYGNETSDLCEWGSNYQLLYYLQIGIMQYCVSFLLSWTSQKLVMGTHITSQHWKALHFDCFIGITMAHYMSWWPKTCWQSPRHTNGSQPYQQPQMCWQLPGHANGSLNLMTDVPVYPSSIFCSQTCPRLSNQCLCLWYKKSLFKANFCT